MPSPPGIQDPALVEELRTRSGDEELSVIVRLSDPDALPSGIRVVTRFGDIATVRVERDRLQELAESVSVSALEASRNLRPSDEGEEWYDDAIDEGDEPVTDSSYTRRPEGLEATGKGVVVAALDWGIDPAHPAFQHPDGSTRIISLWDQRGTEANGPGNRWGYGRIFGQGDIDRALRSGDPYATLGYHPADAGGSRGAHGTHVLDIAAGSGLGGGMPGVAPEADLVFVHLARTTDVLSEGNLGDSASVLEALDHVFSIAGDRPCVVNMSVGAHGGPHDGETLVELGLDRAVSLAACRSCVNSSGNYRTRRAHTTGRVTPGEPKIIPLHVPFNDTNDSELELFYPGIDRFIVEVLGPDNVILARVARGEDSPLINRGAPVGHVYHRVHYGMSGDHHVDLLLRPDAPGGVWTLRLIGADVHDGRYHAWIERDRGLQPVFLEPDVVPSSTTGTLCNARLSLTCGCVNPYVDPPVLATFSSGGPTRDGRVKPELVAPGYRICAARSTPHGEPPGARYTAKSGTSMAAPHLAGAIALMYQAAGIPLEIYDTRALLFSTADPHPFVGRALSEFDLHRFGYGLLDVVAAEQAAREFGSRSVVTQEKEDETLAAWEVADDSSDSFSEEPDEPEEQPDEPESDTASFALELTNGGGTVTEASELSEILRDQLGGISWLQNSEELEERALQVMGLEGGRAMRPIASETGVLLTQVEPGDILIRSAPVAGGRYAAVIISEQPETAASLLERGVLIENAAPGWFVQVVEVPVGGGEPQTIGRRLTDRYGRIPRYQRIFRPDGKSTTASAPDGDQQEAATPEAWPALPKGPVVDTSAVLTWKNLTKIQDSQGGQQVFVVVTGAPAKTAVPGYAGHALFYLEVRNTNDHLNHQSVVSKHRLLRADSGGRTREAHSWISRREPNLEDESSHVLKPFPLTPDTLRYAYQMEPDATWSADRPKARLEVEYHWAEWLESRRMHYRPTGLDFMLVAPIEFLFSQRKLLTPNDITLDDVKYRNDFWIHIDTVKFTPQLKGPVSYELEVTTSLERQASRETAAEKRTSKTKEKSSSTTAGFNASINGEISQGGSAKIGIDVLELGLEQLVKLGGELGYSRSTTDTTTETVVKEITQSLRLTQSYSISEGVTLKKSFSISPEKPSSTKRLGPKSGGPPPERSTVGVYLIPVVSYYQVPCVKFLDVNRYGQATRREEGKAATIPFLRRWILTTYSE